MERDTPIHRVTFLEMSEDEQIKFIENIRNRRTEPLAIYQEAIALKKQAKLEKLNTQFDKAKIAFEKELAGFDKKVESLIKKANKLKQLKIEIDLED